jgi:uncharacterized protein (DUF983 family)
MRMATPSFVDPSPTGRSRVGFALRGALRALLMRCPLCGARGVTRRWVIVRPRCPSCGMRLDRGEDDYWIGALLFNLIAAEILFAGGVLVTLLWTWPHPPWDALYWGSIVGVVVMPIVTYPITKLVWLAFDLVFRPPRAEDFAA